MKKKMLIWIVMIFLLAATTLAVSKPIASKITGATGTIDLFVEIDFLDEKQICTANPSVETGPTGEFATNLANLVFQNFPQTKCGGFWQPGDKIWYEINDQQSEIQEISKGTGLQMLTELIIVSSQPSSPGGSGSAPKTTPTVEKIEESITLTAEQDQEIVEALLNIKLSQNLNKDIQAKILLSDFFNDNIIDIQEDNFFLINEFAKNYLFNLENLQPGQYKIQALLYDGPDLIGVSNIVKFTLTLPQEIIETPQALTEKTQYPVYWYVALIVIIAVLIYLIWRLKKK